MCFPVNFCHLNLTFTSYLFSLFSLFSRVRGNPDDSYLVPFQNLAMPVGKLQQLQKAMELLKVSQQTGAPKSMEEAKKKSYAFWDTQPVPKIGKVTTFW